MLPVVAICGSLIRKLPEISPRAEEDGSADQFAGAEVAGSMTGYLEANRHIDHRPLATGREQSVQACCVIEAVIAPIIDPGGDPAAAKSVKPEIFGHSSPREA